MEVTIGDQSTGFGCVAIPVIYVTDRPQVISADPAADSGVSYGVATVRVPCTEAMMDGSKKQLKDSLTAMGWVQSPKNNVPNPRVSITGWMPATHDPPLVETVSLPHSSVLQKIKNAWLSTDEKEMTIFVHGYSARFENALYTSGYLSACLEKPVICYSWNSQGRSGSRFYKRDEQTVEDRSVQEHLGSFLTKDLTSLMSADATLSAVAHSLGTRLVNSSLNNCASVPVFEKLVLIAPDIRKDRMRQFYGERLANNANDVYIFHNPRDKAFLASKVSDLINLRVPRAKVGRRIATLPGIRFIDFSAVAEPNKLQLHSLKAIFEYAPIGHYLRFEYLSGLLKSGSAPPNHILFDNQTIIPGDAPGVLSVTARELKRSAALNAELARVKSELENCRKQHAK